MKLAELDSFEVFGKIWVVKVY